MDTIQFLREATALAGVPGQEGAVADYIANAMRPLCDSVEINALGSVVARKGQSGPVIMLCAHMDEIGMCVTKIEDDGCLRLRRNGGVDPRVLPAHEVIVKAEGGDLFGVVGAKPPHLLTAAEREKAVTMDSLYVDVGYDAATVRRLTGEGAVKRHIMDMGITKGTDVYVRKVAPLGDPIEVTVRGYELSLRKDEAELVLVG